MCTRSIQTNTQKKTTKQNSDLQSQARVKLLVNRQRAYHIPYKSKTMNPAGSMRTRWVWRNRALTSTPLGWISLSTFKNVHTVTFFYRLYNHVTMWQCLISKPRDTHHNSVFYTTEILRNPHYWNFEFKRTGARMSSHLGLLSLSPSCTQIPSSNCENRFGLHHDSMQSGTEQGPIISWHAGVRECISLHGRVALCQETSRFASTCCPGLHGSPEGNQI